MMGHEGAPKGQLHRALLSQPCNEVQPYGSEDTERQRQGTSQT